MIPLGPVARSTILKALESLLGAPISPGGSIAVVCAAVTATAQRLVEAGHLSFHHGEQHLRALKNLENTLS